MNIEKSFYFIEGEYMKVAFLGDSITEGQIGVSYFDIVKDVFKDSQFDNFGKNGDTVSSLYHRLKKVDFSEYDYLILFIGINDIFGKVNRAHRLVRALQGQSPSKNLESFILEYKELLDHLLKMNKNIIVVSPLLLGEDIHSDWNQKVRETEVEIELLCKSNQLTYLDVQRDMYDFLKDKMLSDYLPISLRQVSKDYISLKTNDQIDKVSKERGLYLTLDGVHLNSLGAEFVANRITDTLQKKEV